MHTWKKRLNNYGLSDSVILLLLVITVVSVISEIISIGIFLPLFELINQNGVESLSNSDSDLVKRIYSFTSLIGLDLTIEILLFSSFILFLSSKVLTYINVYIQQYYRGIIIKSMKDRLLSNYLRAASSYHDTVGIGDFTNSSSVELPLAVSGIMLPIKLVITVVSGLGSIALLLFISPQLTFISVFVIGIGILLPARWVKVTTKVGRKNRHYNSVVTDFLLNRLQSPRLVRLSNAIKMEEDDYFTLTEKQRKLSLIIYLLKARINLVLEPTIIGISLLMFYVALVSLKMPVSLILLYMAVMMRIVPIVTNILKQKQSINTATGPIQAIDKLLSSMNENIDNYQEGDLNKDLINEINTVEVLRLDNISFFYKGCLKHTLSDITCVFKKSTLTAIVGPSGSGKTTLIDIVSGYRYSTAGDLFINEINTNKYDYELLMRLVSYVPQVPQIFNGITIYEHIVYGKEGTTKDEVINASKLSGAYDFIKKLPQGFDTVLGGVSSGISGGQKQRLDLSRALLRNASILIMDEPTGSLDPISENKFMLNINKIRKETNKIIIIIAHRLHTIIDADQIIVLENGKISNIGTHSELLLNNSWYKESIGKL